MTITFQIRKSSLNLLILSSMFHKTLYSNIKIKQKNRQFTKMSCIKMMARLYLIKPVTRLTKKFKHKSPLNSKMEPLNLILMICWYHLNGLMRLSKTNVTSVCFLITMQRIKMLSTLVRCISRNTIHILTLMVSNWMKLKISLLVLD